MVHFTPRPPYPRGDPVPTEQGATWAPKPVWTFCGGKKTSCSYRKENPGPLKMARQEAKLRTEMNVNRKAELDRVPDFTSTELKAPVSIRKY